MVYCIEQLTRAIHKSSVLSQYANHECINGEKKRLGLNTLMKRGYIAADRIQEAIKKCKDMYGLQYDSYVDQVKCKQNFLVNAV
jgi:hypothetical protein